MSTVAFLGLGTMGMGMVQNLMAAGHQVTGWNRTPEPGAPLVERGMKLAPTPRAAAEGADFIIACVSNDEAIERITLGTDGALGALQPGALFIDCGTTSRELTARLAAAVEERGGSYLDAPITGSKLGAAGGKLTLMVGGASADVERARPLFDAMGKHTVHVGEDIGIGQAAKFCLNMSQAVVLEGLLEGYILARSMGVPLARMAEIFENSAGKTGVGSFKTPYLFRGDYEPHFRLDLMHKDLHLALDEAGRRRVPLPAARAVQTLYDQGVAEGMGPEDFLVLARLLERWAGFDLREEPDA